MEEMKFFCVTCKKHSMSKSYKRIGELKNGCFMIHAVCRWCGANICRIVSSRSNGGRMGPAKSVGLDRRSGKGVVNTLMNKIPMPEMHMDAEQGEYVPGGSFNGKKKYSYCGPFTKYEKRIAEGYDGINELDSACKKHDAVYNSQKDRGTRNASDDFLALAASKIANDASKSSRERQDARKVVALIGSKSWLRV